MKLRVVTSIKMPGLQMDSDNKKHGETFWCPLCFEIYCSERATVYSRASEKKAIWLFICHAEKAAIFTSLSGNTLGNAQ